VLRALELSAQVLLKATKVDGVYDKDPRLDPSAKRYERLTYEETLLQGLKVMDLTAFSLAKDQNLPIIVFKFPEKGALKKALMGEPIGTYVGN
jgi:uridylate kinase